MKELGYQKALDVYGEYNKWNNKFIMLRNDEARMLYIDENNYAIVKYNEYYDKNEVIFTNEKKVTEYLLRDIYNSFGEFIIKLTLNNDNKLDHEIVGEELINESPYLFEHGSDIACMTTEKLIYLIKY